MVNDPLGDMLTRIRNAIAAGKREVDLPFSKLKLSVAQLLVREGYLSGAQKAGDTKRPLLHLSIAYEGKQAILTGVKRVSKPGLRWYVGKKEIPYVRGGGGIAILSTPAGIMTGKDAKGKGVGGELLCEVW